MYGNDVNLYLPQLEVTVSSIENGFIVRVMRDGGMPPIPKEFKPIIGLVKSKLQEGEGWKEKEAPEEVEPKIKSGTYMFSEADKLMHFLSEVYL